MSIFTPIFVFENLRISQYGTLVVGIVIYKGKGTTLKGTRLRFEYQSRRKT